MAMTSDDERQRLLWQFEKIAEMLLLLEAPKVSRERRRVRSGARSNESTTRVVQIDGRWPAASANKRPMRDGRTRARYERDGTLAPQPQCAPSSSSLWQTRRGGASNVATTLSALAAAPMIAGRQRGDDDGRSKTTSAAAASGQSRWDCDTKMMNRPHLLATQALAAARPKLSHDNSTTATITTRSSSGRRPNNIIANNTKAPPSSSSAALVDGLAVLCRSQQGSLVSQLGAGILLLFLATHRRRRRRPPARCRRRFSALMSLALVAMCVCRCVAATAASGGSQTEPTAAAAAVETTTAAPPHRQFDRLRHSIAASAQQRQQPANKAGVVSSAISANEMSDWPRSHIRLHTNRATRTRKDDRLTSDVYAPTQTRANYSNETADTDAARAAAWHDKQQLGQVNLYASQQQQQQQQQDAQICFALESPHKLDTACAYPARALCRVTFAQQETGNAQCHCCNDARRQQLNQGKLCAIQSNRLARKRCDLGLFSRARESILCCVAYAHADRMQLIACMQKRRANSWPRCCCCRWAWFGCVCVCVCVRKRTRIDLANLLQMADRLATFICAPGRTLRARDLHTRQDARAR